MDSGSLIVNLKCTVVYKDLADDVKKKCLIHQTKKLKDRYQ